VDIVAGGSFALALLQDGTLVSWGENRGNLGVGDAVERTSPTRVLLPDGVKKIKGLGACSSQAWVIDEEGNMWVWGSMVHHLGGAASLLPVLLPGLKVKVPLTEADLWVESLEWAFLGWMDRGSVFSEMPVEVLFHFVVASKKHFLW
jgi:hypothetical protein